MVTISASSACAASNVHDLTDSPLSNTVQAPHELVSHPIFVPVSPRVSLRYCTSSSLGSTSCWCPGAVHLDRNQDHPRPSSPSNALKPVTLVGRVRDHLLPPL